MKVFWRVQDVPRDPHTVLSVGTFDGVHRGHQVILQNMLIAAQQDNCRDLVVTFHPHPRQVLAGDRRPPIQLLTTIEERLDLLAKFGVQYTLVVHFDKTVAALEAEEFVKQFLVDAIGVCRIFVGTDHSFGKGRRGNVQLLQQLGKQYGFTVDAVPPVMEGGEKISSTRIRKALREGQLAEANQMLGYEYFVCGTVVRGDGRGQLLGFPTANIEPLEPQKLLPKNGVYFVSAQIRGRQVFGMANIGTRPTFTHDSNPRLEVHFLNFDEYLYDERICVVFHQYLREERKFDTVDLFLSQLFEDRMQCEELIVQYQQATLDHS